MLVLTKSEQRALLFVAAILLISIIIQWIRPHTINRKIYDYSMQDSLFKVLSGDTLRADTTINLPRQIPLKGKADQRQKPLKEKSININTASQKDLERLPRIGPATARSIIEYREQHGPFGSIEELTKVKRIGPKTLEQIAPFVTVGSDSL